MEVLFVWLNCGVTGGAFRWVFLAECVHIQRAHHISQLSADWDNRQSSIHLQERTEGDEHKQRKDGTSLQHTVQLATTVLSTPLLPTCLYSMPTN